MVNVDSGVGYDDYDDDDDCHRSSNNENEQITILDSILADATTNINSRVDNHVHGTPVNIMEVNYTIHSDEITQKMEENNNVLFGGKPGDGIDGTQKNFSASTRDDGHTRNTHEFTRISEQDMEVLWNGTDCVLQDRILTKHNDKNDALRLLQQHAHQLHSENVNIEEEVADQYNCNQKNNDNRNTYAHEQSDDDDDEDYDSQDGDGDLIDMVGWNLRRQNYEENNHHDANNDPKHNNNFGTDKNTPNFNVNIEGKRNNTTTDKANRRGLFGGWRSDRHLTTPELCGDNDMMPITTAATSPLVPSWSNISTTACHEPPRSTSKNHGLGGLFRSRSNDTASPSISSAKSFHSGDCSYLRVPCDGVDAAGLNYREGEITGNTIDVDGDSVGPINLQQDGGLDDDEHNIRDNHLRPGDHIFVWQTYGINPRAYQRHAVVFTVTKRTVDGDPKGGEELNNTHSLTPSFDANSLYSHQEEGKDIEVTVVSFYHFQQYHTSHGAALAQQAASGDRRGKRSGCKHESLEDFIGQDGMKRHKPVHKVRYGREVKRGLLSQKAGVGTALKKDEVGLILARVQYLLDHPDHLPDHSALSANGECASLWCVTGRWCTLQGASILAITSVGQAGGALLAGGILSNLTVLVPMPGVWGMAGWWWYVPATVAYPFLVPALVALGMASLVPLEILRRNRKKWRGITDGLNHQFWLDTSDAVKEEYFGVMANAEKEAEMRSFFGIRDGDTSAADDARYMPVGGTPGGGDGIDDDDDDEDEALAMQQIEKSCQTVAAGMDMDLSGRPPTMDRQKGGGGWSSFIGNLKKKECGKNDDSLLETERFQSSF